MAGRDYYDALGVGRGADEAEIKKAYRKIAFENHPDRNPGDKAAEERFKQATEAYEVLRDAEKRARYDQFGHAGVGGAAGGGARGVDFSGFDLADALRAFMRDFGGDVGGFEDLFGATRRGPMRGDDLRVRIQLTLEEIAGGVEKKIRVKHLRACKTCGGKGGSGETQCATCQGSGQIRRVQHTIFGQFVNVTSCPQCGGEGQTLREPCKTCHGEGRVSETETLAVKVPAGVADGNYIPLRGMGDAGPRGGPAGDLIVQIEEKEHEIFERDGNDLHLDVPASFATLATGGAVEVPTLAGDPVSLQVPAGTQTGHVLRVRGKGLPGLRGGRGDLFARLVVWTPARIGAEDRKRLEELERGGALKPPKPSRSLFERMKDAFAG
jgi:molecular chaperone DnaJ